MLKTDQKIDIIVDIETQSEFRSVMRTTYY